MSDLRFGLRVLAKNPGFTLLVAGLLALGIGTTTVIFSLFDTILLRPLPVRHPEELVRTVHRIPKIGPQNNFPYSYYEALHDHATSLAVTFAETGRFYHFGMSDPEPAEQITVHAVSPEFFDGLGVRPLHGRALMSDDANESSEMPPAVLSYRFWQRRFGGDPRVVRGRTITVNGHRFVIVGVMPREFNGLTVDTAPDLRIPWRAFPLLVRNFNRDEMGFELAGRLKPGFTRLQAEAECRAIWQPIMRDYYEKIEKLPPEVVAVNLAQGMELEPLDRGVSILRDRFGNVFKILMASASLLVLIVCTNVAGLLLARATSRQHELAVRLAVGATRFRLVRQVLAESLLLATLGAAGGLFIAVTAMPMALGMLPPIRDLSGALVPLSIDAAINRRIFVFLIILSALTMLVFSLSPAIVACRSNVTSAFRATRSSRDLRGRHLLVVFQIALSTFMLAGASFFVRSLQQLERTDPGFDRDHIATFTGDFSGSSDPPAVLRTLIERVRDIPGVAAVAVSSRGVMRGRGVKATVAPAGARITQTDFLNADVNFVSPNYFDAMGIRILEGRNFTANDTTGPAASSSRIRAIVNQAFATRFFPNAIAVGKRFGVGVEGTVASGKYEIIGVVSDSKYRSMREPIIPAFYDLEPQFAPFVLNVRTRIRPELIIEPVRKALASVDPSLPFLEVGTLTEEVDRSMAGERLTAALASLFGLIAAVLVGVGIYGLLAFIVTQRQREIGIRMALGAQATDIGKLIAGQTIVMAAVGILLGLVAALAAATGMRSLLYGISPQDPKSLAGAAIFVVLVAAVATVLPAVRATRTKPSEALRYQS